MRVFLAAPLLVETLFSAVSLAQSAPSAQNPSAPQSEAQPATQPQSTSQPTQPPTSAPTAATQQQTAAQHRIAPGSVIPVQLTKTIDAKKAKPGDEVVAKVTMDLKTNSGEVIVPKDTKVVGHVTEVQARSKEQKDSQVAIIFDRAVMKNGGEMEMPMTIQAIIAPQASTSGHTNNGNDPSTAAPNANASGAS